MHTSKRIRLKRNNDRSGAARLGSAVPELVKKAIFDKRPNGKQVLRLNKGAQCTHNLYAVGAQIPHLHYVVCFVRRTRRWTWITHIKCAAFWRYIFCKFTPMVEKEINNSYGLCVPLLMIA